MIPKPKRGKKNMNLQPRLGEEAPWLTKNRRSLERNSLTISRVWEIHLQQKMIPKNLEKKPGNA